VKSGKWQEGMGSGAWQWCSGAGEAEGSGVGKV
jgi:hypothetical protein